MVFSSQVYKTKVKENITYDTVCVLTRNTFLTQIESDLSLNNRIFVCSVQELIPRFLKIMHAKLKSDVIILKPKTTVILNYKVNQHLVDADIDTLYLNRFRPLFLSRII